MRSILEHQTPPEKDVGLIEKVAAALATLDDFTLEVIGASSSRASNVVRAAAIKAAKARSTKYAHRNELATIEREIQQSKKRLDDLEVELAAVHRDREGDDWSREQEVNRIRATRSESSAGQGPREGPARAYPRLQRMKQCGRT